MTLFLKHFAYGTIAMLVLLIAAILVLGATAALQPEAILIMVVLAVIISSLLAPLSSEDG